MGTSQASMSSKSDRALLRFLVSNDDGRHVAWKEFLHRYSDLFLKIAWEFESDYDGAMEAYLHVCRRLAADDFAKLRTYDPDRGETPAKVSTWLAVVVRNLCIEYCRQTEGRRRYPKAVEELSEFDQRVFELYFWEDYSEHEVVRRLDAGTDRHNRSVGDALHRLKALQRETSATWGDGPGRPSAVFEEGEYSPSVVDQTGHVESNRREWVASLLDDLPDEERLVVRWSYWCDVSATGISRLLQVSQRRVYTLLNRALRKLRRRVHGETGDRRTARS